MWNPLKKHKLSRDWRLVSTLQAYFNHVDINGKDMGTKDTIFYYLYENGLGQRKCEHDATGHASGKYRKEKRETHPYYLGRIRPWLAGQFDPEIPNYESIKTKEFKDSLAGKVT